MLLSNDDCTIGGTLLLLDNSIMIKEAADGIRTHDIHLGKVAF